MRHGSGLSCYGRAERSTPRSRPAGPRAGEDTSGGRPPGGGAAPRLRRGGAPRAGPPPAGPNDRPDSAHFAGLADPAGAAPVPRGAASTGHRHRRGAPRRAALTPQDLINGLRGGRDVVLRRTLGRSRSGALLSTDRWMRPCVRRRAALGCPPRAGNLSGPAVTGDGAHHRRDLVTDPRSGTAALFAGGDQNSPETARPSEQVITPHRRNKLTPDRAPGATHLPHPRRRNRPGRCNALFLPAWSRWPPTAPAVSIRGSPRGRLSRSAE